MIEVERTNTVLYCEQWAETVAFYRDCLGLPMTFENDWFVEFELCVGSYVSVADTRRASIAAGDGRGVTLSWRVPDVTSTRGALEQAGVAVGVLTSRFDSTVVDLHDPAGNRIELWS